MIKFKPNPPTEFMRIHPDGSFKLGDGVDPLFALGELSHAFIRQREHIKKLECMIALVREHCDELSNIH